jgi:predicted lipoprotein with Yx(FWY)xxD motif
MGNFKKVFVSSLVLLGLMAGVTALSAAAAEPLKVKSETDIAGDLGILQGEGNGLTAEYLNKPTTRLQAAVMSLRLKGLEAEALAYTGTTSFKDASSVSKENQAILGYLKANPSLGWQGTGDDKFEPLSGITAQQYYKVLLESLGYTQGTDFEYANVFTFAGKNGLSKIANVKQFKNLHIATATIEALKVPIKGTVKTLAADLTDKGKISATKLDVLKNAELSLKQSDTLGSYLTDSKGMTLYYFTKDAADVNSCVGQCLANWPIFSGNNFTVPAEFSAADFKVFVRADGKEQLTYKGWPLYYFVKDQKAGDTTGDNVGKVWFVIKPSNGGVALGTKADLGNYLTDANGMALYYYDKDTKGVSNCSGKCLEKWPLFYAPNITPPTGVNSADFGTLIRADGKMQTTYKGFPLYYWVDDKKMGDTLGQDVGKVWYVIDPAKFSGTKAANTSVKTSKSDALGTYLVDQNGMALYLFTKDKADPNSCVGQCLVNWPIFYDASLTVSSDLTSSDFGTLTRNDGTKQSTYKGWPLYYWIKDHNPGETTGQNVGKVWFVLDPAQTTAR